MFFKKKKKKNFPPQHVTHFPENTDQVWFLLLLITYVMLSGEHCSIFWFHMKKSDSLSLWKFSFYN